MTVYLDELFLLNLIINYLLLSVAAALSSTPLRRGRFVAAAGLGAVYAVLVFFPELRLLYSLGLKAAVTCLISLTAYGFGGLRRFIRRTGVFLVSGFAFAGALALLLGLTEGEGLVVRNGAVYAAVPSVVLAAVAVIVYIILTLLLKNAPSTAALPPAGARVELRRGERRIEFDALADTGNRLREPLSGDGVVIVELERGRELIEPRAAELIAESRDAVEALEALGRAGLGAGFRLVPYSTIDREGGFLLAARADSVRVNGKRAGSRYVAFSKAELSESGGFAGIIGA